MENIFIEPTKATPKVFLDFESNVFSIEGQSYPENAAEFYSQIIKSINTHIKETHLPFILNLKLLYLNTSSTMSFMNLFEKLEDTFKKKKTHITVNWYYDEKNELAFECGEEFKEDFTFPFHIIQDKIHEKQ